MTAIITVPNTKRPAWQDMTTVCGLLTVANLENALSESLAGQLVGSLHHTSVVLGTPAGRVDVDVLTVEAESLRLHRVTHVAVQHSDT